MGIWKDITGGLNAIFSGSGGGGSGLGGLVNSIAPTVVSGLAQNYLNNRNRATLEDLQGIASEREAANYEQDMANWEEAQHIMQANAAAKRQAIRQAMALQQEYYKRAMQFYQPYIKAGQEALPVATATYKGGMSALSQALGQAMGGLNQKGVF